MRDHEDSAVAATRAAYAATRDKIQEKLDALIKRIQQAQDAGENITASWLYAEERYEQLLDQLNKTPWVEPAAAALTAKQAAAVQMAASQAERFTYLSAGVGNAKAASSLGIVWHRLPADRLEALTGYSGDGSPLATLFTKVAKENASDVRDALLAGVGRGASAKEIAADLLKVADITENRAYLIARNETNRAARAATLEAYAGNAGPDGAIDGWTWLASCDRRTCGACFALHGTLHLLDEPFGSHPACRCCAVPHLKDYRTSPDQPDLRPVIEPGADRFAALGPDDQKAILGVTLQQKYAAGEITLADMVHEKHSIQWGVTRTQASILQAETNAAQRPQEPIPHARR